MFRPLKSPNKRTLFRLTSRFMSSKATVMSFGDGSHGALGLPTSVVGLDSDVYEPTPIPGLPENISSISAGHYHSLALTSDGHVWAWGRNNESQLGRDPLSPRETWYEPKKVDGLDQVKVGAAFASGVVSAAIGDDGSLWVWGKSKRGQLGVGREITECGLPSRVEALTGEEIIKVSLGWGHALALTKQGKLFRWGYYADGRLGKVGNKFEISPLDSSASKPSLAGETSGPMIGIAEKLVEEAIDKEKDMPIVWEPSLVEELGDVEVADIACGLDHSLVLCRDGTLLSGGSNVYGQLGRENPTLGFHPVDISSRALSVASGLGHSLAICNPQPQPKPNEESGYEPNVVSWGWNQSSQLGREGPESIPMSIEGLANERPISVSGGRAHSFAVTANKQLWAWGCGRNGRLGLGGSFDEAEPCLIESLQDFEVLQVAAGFDHNLVLVAE